MKALLIKDGEFQIIDTPASLKDMQKLVGGYFAICFNVPLGKGSRILGWCNEDAMHREPFVVNVALGLSLRLDAPYPIGGPILVLGCDWNGSNAGLTDKEIEQFSLVRRGGQDPILQWRRA